MGIEPTYGAWEAPILPLNYTRMNEGLMIIRVMLKCQCGIKTTRIRINTETQSALRALHRGENN